MMDGRELGRKMLGAVKAHIANALLPLTAGVEELRLQLKALPTPKDGKPGADGKDVDPVVIKQLVDHAVAGVKEMISASVAEAVLAMPEPLPGERGEPGKPGADGDHGRDALDIAVLPAIDEAKVYPRGTLALHKGGAIYAIRKTDPIIDSLEKAGWKVWSNGIAAESEETLDEGRIVKRTTVYTDGSQSVREIKTSVMLYREVWREGEYERGDIATWAGSTWHCQRTTADEPGKTDAWKLMVKKGAAGRDWNDPKAKQVREPVRLK